MIFSHCKVFIWPMAQQMLSHFIPTIASDVHYTDGCEVWGVAFTVREINPWHFSASEDQDGRVSTSLFFPRVQAYARFSNSPQINQGKSNFVSKYPSVSKATIYPFSFQLKWLIFTLVLCKRWSLLCVLQPFMLIAASHLYGKIRKNIKRHFILN